MSACFHVSSPTNINITIAHRFTHITYHINYHSAPVRRSKILTVKCAEAGADAGADVGVGAGADEDEDAEAEAEAEAEDRCLASLGATTDQTRSVLTHRGPSSPNPRDATTLL